MDDFDPKRPASDDAVKGKRGRPKKKPNYDKAETISDLLKKAVELYDEPYDDRKERSKGAPSLSAVAREMNTTTIRVKKMLVTAGFYSTAISRKVQELLQNGADMQEIMSKTGLKDASVYSYMPYSKGVYNMDDPTLCAEQNRRYRMRKAVVLELEEHLDEENAEEYLWKAIVAFEDYLFETENENGNGHGNGSGLPFRYKVNDEELLFSREDVRMTRATINEMFRNVREVQKRQGFVSGPNELKTFGASYLYPIFLRIGVIKNNSVS